MVRAPHGAMLFLVVALTLLGFLGWAFALLVAMALVALVVWLVLHGFGNTGPGGPPFEV